MPRLTQSRDGPSFSHNQPFPSHSEHRIRQRELYSAPYGHAELNRLRCLSARNRLETWREQWALTGDDDATREHFGTLVLIEAVVHGLTDNFDMGKFGQLRPAMGQYPSHMQVGYDEGLLSGDGETPIDRRINCIHGSGTLRFAVYPHMFDPTQPLLWQGGKVACPPFQDVPVRLLTLMPYRACR